jgi:hypothetical protein
MKFSSVTETNGKLTLIQLNEHPFLTLTLKIIESSYMLGDSPLINNGLQNGYNILNQHYLKLT